MINHSHFHILNMKSFAPLSLLSLALAAAGNAASLPTKTLARRADFCDQWGSVTTGSYIVYNNLWGQSYDTSGKQCTGIDSVSGTNIAWHSSWSWAGTSNQVKSFANVALDFTARKLSAVNSIKSNFKWRLVYSEKRNVDETPFSDLIQLLQHQCRR